MLAFRTIPGQWPKDLTLRRWKRGNSVRRKKSTVGIAKLRRRISELQGLDAKKAYLEETAANDMPKSNVRETIRDVFGPNPPEFNDHQSINF